MKLHVKTSCVLTADWLEFTPPASLEPLWLQVKLDFFNKSFRFNMNRNALFYSFMNFNELLQMLHFLFSLENQLILVCDVII